MIFTFKKEYLEKLKKIIDRFFKQTEDNSQLLKLLYKELFSAQQCFDMLSEKSIRFLNEQKDILITDFEYMKTLLVNSIVSQQVINNLKGVKTRAMEYIFGKKVSIIQDALKLSKTIFAIPIGVKESMIKLMSGSAAGKGLYLDLEKRFGDMMNQIETEKLNLRKSNREKVQIHYASSDTEFKITTDIIQLERLLKEAEKKHLQKRSIQKIRKNLDNLKQKQIELIMKKNNQETKIAVTFRILQDINAQIELSESLITDASEAVSNDKSITTNSNFGIFDSVQPSTIEEDIKDTTSSPSPRRTRTRSRTRDRRRSRTRDETREGGSKKRKTRKLYRNKK